jgi:hypothetical protein
MYQIDSKQLRDATQMPIVQVYQIAHDGDVSSSTEKLGSKLKRQESLSPNVVKIYGQEAAFLLKKKKKKKKTKARPSYTRHSGH